MLTACDDEAAVLRTLQFSQLIAATLASGTGTDYTLELRDTYGGGVTAVVESPGDESIARDLLDRIVAHALQTRKAPFQLITACHAPELAGSGVADHAMHPGLGF